MGQSNSRAANPPPGRRQDRPPPPWTRRLSRTFDLQSHLHSRPQSSMSFRNQLPEEQSAATTAGVEAGLSRRHLRLTRARTSFPIPGIFNRHTSNPQREESNTTSQVNTTVTSDPRPSSRRAASDGPGYWLPRLQVPELDINFDNLQPNTESETRESSTRSSPNIAGRISSLRPDRSLRNMTNSLRRRRSPLRRDEDQAAMLSRLLSVAAAATAASLMGDDHRTVSSARNVPSDSDEGTFDNFLQALQNGRIASALRQNGADAEDESDASGGVSAPLNFFRMFRFGPSASINGRGDGQGSSQRGQGAEGEQSSEGGGEERTDGRMVPIIIVGIRSINPASGAAQDDNNIPPFIDALSNFPAPLAAPGESTIDGILRQPQNGTRFTHRRRASMGGLNTFPSTYDAQRHQRFPEHSRPWSTVSDASSGPRPPPSTPASPGVSAVSSGSNTPTRAPTSAVPSHAPSRRESFIRRATGAGLASTAEEPQHHSRTPRQRRLSESDFTRFGSGASRRNGVVEPDTSPTEGSRSWIIYVLGGSYPENHPILTTPSLFTDSPTYEDMLLLSALLGPAKPPVASEADVAAAPGLFRISGTPGTLVALAVDGGEDRIVINPEERCLVCLCEFEVDEEARRLVQCGHFFHRECIDQWLTTGRNSCPLCRGQGVDEKGSDGPSSSENGTARTTSTSG